MPGHDSGHADPRPPIGLSWESVVLAWVQELGGWSNLSNELVRRGHDEESIPTDVTAVEKGLRRLAKREHRPGGQYGRWLTRYFGIPASLEHWARWMGQYHSRFADLPTGVRWQQLSAWDKPPVSETRISAWIHIGFASVMLRMGDLTSALARLEMAEGAAAVAGEACLLELMLVRAKLQTDMGDRRGAASTLDEAGALLGDAWLDEDDRLCYHARWISQRAYHLTSPHPQPAEAIAEARRLFESIPEEPFVPFVAFRKCNGLAYCAWRLGWQTKALSLARLAEQHAGDGGLVRFRVMSLKLQANIEAESTTSAAHAQKLLERAKRLAELLEDADLSERLRR